MSGAQASRNALAHAVFFTRLGELRDRSFENQHDRASGLNLVVAAIILWNTVYVWRQDARLERDEFRGLLPQSVP
jgi:TnpA family transposase